MKNCRIEEETDDSYINNTLIIITGTFRMDLKINSKTKLESLFHDKSKYVSCQILRDFLLAILRAARVSRLLSSGKGEWSLGGIRPSPGDTAETGLGWTEREILTGFSELILVVPGLWCVTVAEAESIWC